MPAIANDAQGEPLPAPRSPCHVTARPTSMRHPAHQRSLTSIDSVGAPGSSNRATSRTPQGKVVMPVRRLLQPGEAPKVTRASEGGVQERKRVGKGKRGGAREEGGGWWRREKKKKK